MELHRVSFQKINLKRTQSIKMKKISKSCLIGCVKWVWQSHLLSRNWELCAVCCVLDSGGPGLGLGLVLWLALGLGLAAAEFVLRIALARPPPRVAFRADSSCWRAAWACWRSNWSCIWSCWSWEAEGPELSWPPAERRTPDNCDRSSGGSRTERRDAECQKWSQGAVSGRREAVNQTLINHL